MPTLSITVTECRRTWQEPMFLYAIFSKYVVSMGLCLCRPHRAPPLDSASRLPGNFVYPPCLPARPWKKSCGCPCCYPYLERSSPISFPRESNHYSAVKKTGAVWIHIRTFNSGCHLIGTIRLPLHAAFVDLTAAFDSVDRLCLWREDLHTGTTSRVRIADTRLPAFYPARHN